MSAHNNPTLECLSALSVILDLANGLEEDKSLLTAAFALQLAQEAGCGADEQSAAFFASLLRHLGCTAYASVESTLAADDVALRSRLMHSDASRVGDVISAVAGANSRLVGRGLGLLRLATQARTLRGEWASEACGAARVLSEQLRLGSRVSLALEEVFERWDGAGSPKGVGGEDLSRVGRVALTRVLHRTRAGLGRSARASGEDRRSTPRAARRHWLSPRGEAGGHRPPRAPPRSRRCRVRHAEKLGVDTRAAAALLAVRHGLLDAV